MGYVPPEKFRVPFGKGVVRKEGSDVTVVALSQMVYEAIKAARELASEGISVEVIDPRTLKPLDEELILQSARKTGCLVIADVACKTGGVGAEIACRVVERSPESLQAPVRRVNFPDTPTPCSPVLEEAYYPNSKSIKETIKQLCKG